MIYWMVEKKNIICYLVNVFVAFSVKFDYTTKFS